MLLAVGETAWDSSCRKHGTLLRSAVGFGIHMQWLHRGRVRLLLPAAPWLAPPVPSKQIGAEQLPSIDGTFERSMPGSALLPGPSVSSSRLHGGIHEQSWSPGGVALGRDLHGSDPLGSAILPANASARLRERARLNPYRFFRLEIRLQGLLQLPPPTREFACFTSGGPFNSG